MPPAAPLVSIIMPCRNGAEWLEASLESALAQTWKNREIIVVDDGSTDATPEILRNYAVPGIRTFRQDPLGQSAALNHGFRESRGEYVKFFDCDDLLSPAAIEVQVHALRKTQNCVAYGEWARFYDDPSEANFCIRPGWADGDPIDWLLETWADAEPMYQCGLWLLPRTIIEQVGGWDERLTLINDFEFFTRIVLASSGIRFTSGARLFYRSGNADSLSAQKTREAWESAILSAQLATENLRANEDSPRTREASATILKNVLFSVFSEHKDLAKLLENEIHDLGGSSLQPQGGAAFRLCTRTLGWKNAFRLRALLQKKSPHA